VTYFNDLMAQKILIMFGRHQSGELEMLPHREINLTVGNKSTFPFRNRSVTIFDSGVTLQLE